MFFPISTHRFGALPRPLPFLRGNGKGYSQEPNLELGKAHEGSLFMLAKYVLCPWQSLFFFV
mgnify:CR=1 FL=1|jgi:hypothetical protein